MPSDWQAAGAPRWRWPALGAVAVLHVCGLCALLPPQEVRAERAEPPPLFVSFIAAPPAPRPAAAPPPEAKPVKPLHQQRLLSTPQATTPSPMLTPPEPEPEPEPEPAPATPVAAASPAQPVPETAGVAAIPPNFIAAYLDNPPPVYSQLSRRLRESGTVLLRVRVSVEGRSEQVGIEQGSGFERLDQAAVEAVRRWRFVPAKQGEQAIAASVIVPINFRLDQ